MTLRLALRMALCALLAALPAALLATTAMAHTGEGAAGRAGGLATGFLHPILGLDHVAAMLAVGLWGALLGRPALWMLVVVFPLAMAAGGALAIEGVALPGVETGIALSGVVLGLLVALAARAPLWVSVALVGAFALFHGHAHGAEIPAAASPALYAGGFLAGTTLLHLMGAALGLLALHPRGAGLVRGAGAALALVGGAFLLGLA